ncbi:MAG: hypothetical protein R3C12_04155 [Planctomycetaceae bacterium]|nr:hypothetical protein [Planctomycetaceae bacterium]
MKTVLAQRAITFMLAAVIISTLIYSTHITAAPNRPATQLPYRVEMTAILDRDDAKLVTIRVDSGTAFYATVDHGEGHTSCASTLDPTSKLHQVEIVLLLDHIPSRQCVKELLTVGGAGGPSAQPVNSDYKLNDNFTAKVINGNYKRDQTVDLLAWQDRTFTLSIGK